MKRENALKPTTVRVTKNSFNECEISQNSSVINRTIGELSFWQKTGATIIAIRRGGSITLSPGPQFIIEANDVLVLVGDQETKDFVNTFIA